MGLFDNLKATLSGENESGETFVIFGDAFRCRICGHTRFDPSIVTFDDANIDPGWAGNKARALKCCQCGHIDWFALED